MKSKQNPSNSIVHETSQRYNEHYHVYMIPGNPGLISFYDTFLLRLKDQLEVGLPGRSFRFEGKTLGGFEVGTNETNFKEPLGLKQQVRNVYGQIFENLQTINSEKEKVILMGHSVGAFFLLETIRQYNELNKERQLPYEIVGGLCLFPTVFDIGKSPSGLRLRWLANIPYFPLIISLIAKVLIVICPVNFLAWLVKTFTGFPDEGVANVVAFLNSRMGVRQALHMGRDEVNEITSDRWDEDVWGTAGSKSTSKLYFLFGKDDHWIAEETREDLIRLKGDQVKMEVDETGLPHAFCIVHSEQVADRCADYIKEIVLAN